MEVFLDHMMFVCFSFIVVALVIGIPVYLGEYILEKLNLTEKVVNFMFNGSEEED